MMNDELKLLIREGITAIANGNTLMALMHFEEANRQGGANPTVFSYLGFCLAREHRQFNKGASLCTRAIQAEPNRSVHYLNLGRVYLMAGQRGRAISAFRHGLKRERNQQIINELRKMGLRKSPVLGSLRREHFLNKLLGFAYARLGFR